MVKPSQMPRKVNPIHTLILGALIETVSGAPRYPLARNVSDQNIDVMARRWAA